MNTGGTFRQSTSVVFNSPLKLNLKQTKKKDSSLFQNRQKTVPCLILFQNRRMTSYSLAGNLSNQNTSCQYEPFLRNSSQPQTHLECIMQEMASRNSLRVKNMECTNKFMKSDSSSYLHVQGSLPILYELLLPCINQKTTKSQN